MLLTDGRQNKRYMKRSQWATVKDVNFVDITDLACSLAFCFVVVIGRLIKKVCQISGGKFTIIQFTITNESLGALAMFKCSSRTLLGVHPHLRQQLSTTAC